MPQHVRVPRRVPIPAHLRGAAFRAGDAAFHGLGHKRLRSPDVARPFTGVRAIDPDLASPLGRSRAYEPLLRPGEAFSHATAAMLHGLPLPPAMATAPLHVLSPPRVARARTQGVVGHEASASFGVMLRYGLPVVDPVLAWCQLGAMLEEADLIALGDAIVTGRREGSVRRPPLASIDELAAGVREWGRRRGARALAAALPRVRRGADSRPETLTRLLLVDAGLPEPAIQPAIEVEDGTETLHPDLAYPEWRIAFEYEGERHLEPGRWKRDITRREKFETAGWRVVRVTSDDVFADPAGFLARMRRLIAARTASARPMHDAG